MSNILKFPLERVQRRSYGMPDTSHSADILVYEGVRYEKTVGAKKPIKTKKNSKKRKVAKS